MTLIRYAIRRAKGAQRIRGKRWIAQGETPGGRKIVYARTRNKAPAKQKIEQEIRQAISSAANAGAIEIDSQNSAGVNGNRDYSTGGARNINRSYE